MQPKILLVGLGGLGSTILELLARQEWVGPIVVASRSAEKGTARCNLVRLGALAQGYAPDLSFVPLDLNDQEAVVRLVRQLSPDLVLHTATLQPWWLADLLPDEPRARLRQAGFGVWLPLHLPLTLRLMEALQAAGYGGVALSAPFPDVVNCVLGRLGLAPTCGVGNLAEIVPKVRHLAAGRLGVAPTEVRVWMVGHHALERYVFGRPGEPRPPYFLRVERAGHDVTAEVQAEELLFSPYPLPSGPVTHFLTAGAAVRLVQALFAEEETLIHAPGPHGLPGGYPLLVGNGEVHLAPIPGLTPEEAIAINERSHPFDGIERVEPDGTVVFVPEAAAVLRRELGYDCSRLPPREAEERAKELMERFRCYARSFGVDLGAAQSPFAQGGQ